MITLILLSQLSADTSSTSTIASYDVSVVATRVARTGGSAHVIRIQQLERFEYDDPHAILSGVPGLYSRGEDGVGLRPNIGLRGVNPDRSKKVTLMEDGVLFAPAPYSAPAAYYFPLMTRMQAVRVIKGPSSISFGPHTVGGAVDLTTRTFSSTSAGMLDLAGGEHMYGKAHGFFSWSDDRLGFLVEGLHVREDGFKTLPDPASTGFHKNEWMLKAFYAFDPDYRSRHELEAKLTYSDENSRETYLGLSDSDFARDSFSRYFASELDQMRWHRVSGVLTHKIKLSRDISLSTSAYRHDLSRVWRKVNHFRGASLFEILTAPEDPRNAVYYAILRGEAESSTPEESLFIGPNQREFVSQGIQTKLRLDADTGPVVHRFEGGARLHYDRVERRHSEDAYQLSGGELVPEGSPTIVTVFNEASTLAGAFYATDAISFWDFTLTPGLRVEVFRSTEINRIDQSRSSATHHAILPGASLFWTLHENFGLLAGVHRGFSPPAPGSDRSISPESSVDYEAGARYSRGLLRAELIGFYNDYSNLTDVCTLSSGCLDQDLDRQFDAGKARIFGVEAFAEHELPAGDFKLPFVVAYTLTKAEFRNTFNSDDPIFGSVTAGDEIPYIPRHQLRVSAGVEQDLAGINAGLTYISAMREVAGREPFEQTLATDQQLIFDVGGKVRIIPGVSIYANVRNLLDERSIVSRRPFGARPNAPRWIQVGIKLTSF